MQASDIERYTYHAGQFAKLQENPNSISYFLQQGKFLDISLDDEQKMEIKSWAKIRVFQNGDSIDIEAPRDGMGLPHYVSPNEGAPCFYYKLDIKNNDEIAVASQDEDQNCIFFSALIAETGRQLHFARARQISFYIE